MQKFSRILSSAILLFSGTLQAQVILTGSQAQEKIKGAELVRTSQFSLQPSFIRFKSGNEIELNQFTSWMNDLFKGEQAFTYKLIHKENDKIGMTHYRYQQIINGYPVENGIWIVHTKNNKIVSMNGLLYQQKPSTTISLTEEVALQNALNHVNAQVYKWQSEIEEAHIKKSKNDPGATHYPKGELTYTSPKGVFQDGSNRLAWKFIIYASKPLYKAEIFVDAVTGEIINEKELIHEADTPGTAVTAYSGTQPMIADSFAGGFRLREAGRGDGIFTYNMLTGTDYGAAVDFTDADNFWNNVNAQQDEVATDAHWGAEMTYDYFMMDHGRNSIDGAGFALISYVHYDAGFANAFWDGDQMTYGDGSGSMGPLTAIDITGHEISHGLTTFTADLVYQDEPGALNESFSDIFGVSVEWFANPPTADWTMGEDIGTTIRSMSNPNAYGDPDTYFGTNWAPLGGADNGGVHTNSGVQNFWYYLLVNGGSGTNDNGDNYSVTGLGLDNAGDIAFRNLTVYLTTSSQYADARFYAIQSAIDLFGACTPEVESVTNAWYAVGVGEEYVSETVAAFVPNTTGGCVNPLTVSFSNSSNNGTSFVWYFGDGGTSTATNPSHTYTADGIYNVSLIADGGLCGIDTLTVTNQIFVGQLPDPIVTNGGRCDAGPVNLSASGSGVLSWYNVPTGGTPLGTGTNFTTPSISTTTTYYVESATSAAPQYVGPVDNSFAGGGYFSGNQHLVFDAYRPFTLKSVWVDANSSGNRTIQLRDNTGSVIQSAVINIPAGQSRVSLNFNVPVGTNLQLGTLTGSNPDLYRNNAGAVYPYEIPGLVSITNSSASVSGYYYFFYDWEIEEVPCQSDRVPVDAGILTTPVTTGDSRCGAGIVNLGASASTGTLNWYDMPTGGTLVNSGPTFNPNLTATTTYYVEEELTGSPQFVGAVDNTIGSGAYFNGDQHLVFDVLAPCVLQSVRVFTGSAGNRTVELRNSSGAVIQSAVVFMPNGDNRVNLGFTLTPGTNYQLGWTAGSAPDLYRNSAGAVYPYTIPGLVSITSSSAAGAYYYGYYDWEILTPCVSARTPVTGTINTDYDASITSPPSLCAADGPVNLTAVDAGGTWTGTGITDGVNGTFDPGVSGIGIHTITYTIGGVCGDVGTLNLNVTNTLDATITSGTTICSGNGPTNLSATDAGGTWTGTGITDGVNGTFDPSVGPGTYTVTYTITGTCGSADTEDFNVVVSEDASITMNDSTVCDDASNVNLTSLNTGGTWSATCGTCINTTTGEFNPVTAGVGTWNVIYTISGTCGDDDTVTITVDNCSGLNSVSNGFDFALFPNPANEMTTVKLIGYDEGNLTMTDGIGQLIYQSSINNSSAVNIPLAGVAKGIYLVKFENGSTSLTKKLIVH